MNLPNTQQFDPEDLIYIAALILNIKKHPWQESRLLKNLILIIIGAVSVDCFEDSGKLTFSSGYDDLLEDFIENFMELYPHYFDRINPVFALIVCSIIDLGL